MDQFNGKALPGRLRRPQGQRLSDVLAGIADEAEGPVTIEAIRDELGARSFAALLIFFSAVNLLPLPPGGSFVLGLPLVIVAAQMAYGSATAWLPQRILQKSFSAEQFRSIVGALNPRLRWVERWVKPRYWPFWPGQGDRVIGAVALVMAIVVTLPIPFANWLPAGAALLVGLALSERDGAVFALGIAVGAVALTVVSLVIGSAGALVAWTWTHFVNLF